MANRERDWFNQSLKDLEQAKISLKHKRYEWACFASHQAAEKAIKSLHLHLGEEVWGHTIEKLLKELPFRISQKLIDKAKVLDSFYIPTRYPNGFPEGAPYQHYGKLQAEEAIKYAKEIIEFVRSKMAI